MLFILIAILLVAAGIAAALKFRRKAVAVIAIVLAVVTGCLAVNIVHFTRAYRAHREHELLKTHVTVAPDDAVMTIPIQPNDHENDQD